MTTRIKLTSNRMQGDEPAPDYSNAEKVCIAPNWEQTAIMLCMILQDGSPMGKADAQAEVVRMGQMLDKVKAAQDAAKRD